MNLSSSTNYIILMLAIAGGVTFLLRALPFLLFGSGKRSPAVIKYIGKMLSPAAIAMLSLYCFGSYFVQRPPLEHCLGAAEILAAITVVLLQWLKGNPLISILAGTAIYMILIQTIIP